MRLVLAIVKKEFLQLRRDPRLIAFILFFPVVLMTLFGLALKLEPENVRMAYVDKDQSLFSNLIKTNILTEGYFELVEVGSDADIRRAIQLGNARAGLYIPGDFSLPLPASAQLPLFVLALAGFAIAFTAISIFNFRKYLD